LELWQSCSHDELLALIRTSPPEQGARVTPLLAFLGGGGANRSIPKEDITDLQNWVIQTLGKQMRLVKNPSITTRRDLALIASVCAAPARGIPRKWPVSCLKIKDQEVILWDARIEESCFALALRLWHAWRERLSRPDQRRLYRKSPSWSTKSMITNTQAGTVVAPAANSDGETLLAREIHRSPRVRHIRAANDNVGTTVDHSIVHFASGFIFTASGGNHAPPEVWRQLTERFF
jgi:hypothetical protein